MSSMTVNSLTFSTLAESVTASICSLLSLMALVGSETGRLVRVSIVVSLGPISIFGMSLEDLQGRLIFGPGVLLNLWPGYVSFKRICERLSLPFFSAFSTMDDFLLISTKFLVSYASRLSSSLAFPICFSSSTSLNAEF